jgi:hypothetical protein
MRSPSPETIARMSMTSVLAGQSRPSGSRHDSLESDPTADRRRSREGSLPVGDDERRGSKDASVATEIEVVRPRSPKPEADGKLDR